MCELTFVVVDLLVDGKECVIDEICLNENLLVEFFLLQLMFKLGGEVILDVLNAIIIEAVILSSHYDLVDSRNVPLIVIS